MYSPVLEFARLNPARRWCSDAILNYNGGFCLELGLWWRYDLSADERKSSPGAGAKSRMPFQHIFLNYW